MARGLSPYTHALLVACLSLLAESLAAMPVAAELTVETRHRWREPFGLDRIGAPVVVTARVNTARPGDWQFEVAGITAGREVGRGPLELSWRRAGEEDYEGLGRIELASLQDEVALYARRGEAPAIEVGRTRATYPEIEAAAAPAMAAAHPVDHGLIFVPNGWLVLGPADRPRFRVALIAYHRQFPNARLRAWLESAPRRVHQQDLPLLRRVREERTIEVPAAPRRGRTRDTLHITVTDGQDRTLWRATMPVIIVPGPPQLPAFAARQIKLRYELPILINRSPTGQLDMNRIDTMPYEQGWPATFHDVVVSLPNGSRFIFWRGASYIPFWAGTHNTGTCYEWAETTPPDDGFVDSVEPLMDKELRYTQVQIVQSTTARVHVRWSYQSTDFNYKVWGDGAVEDFYFYPDGYGTRVLNLKRRPEAIYELSEFIILSSPGMYPLSFLPRQAVEMIYLSDGHRQGFQFPPAGPLGPITPDRREAVVYRVRAHRDDRATAIYFHPSDDHFPAIQFGPFFDDGKIVTPAYWGSHWPLARGKSTGARIDPLIDRTPSHTSLLSWAQSRKPDPDLSGRYTTLDTLGRPVEMAVEHYAWLIGMTDEPDDRLLDRARSFADPPALELRGAELDFDSYARARRALRLHVHDRNVSIVIKPRSVTVNPVFEMLGAPQRLRALRLNGQVLPTGRFAWDGQVLWLDVTLREPVRLDLEFR
jgi:hypothetical protein